MIYHILANKLLTKDTELHDKIRIFLGKYFEVNLKTNMT
jgi:hypothetical protein